MQLEVLLVYEDFQMGLRGRKIFDFFAKEVAAGDAARLAVWRFDCFRSVELASEAGHRAESADVIIVAARCSHSLPGPVRDWLECWPPRRTRPGVMVASFSPTASVASQLPDASLLLWRAASRAQMDFICHADCVPAGVPSGPVTASSSIGLAPASARVPTGGALTVEFAAASIW
jgi:hypothetical protein